MDARRADRPRRRTPTTTAFARPPNGGLTIVFYTSQDTAYADLQAGNLDVLDAVPDSALATFEDEFGDRAVNQPAAIFQGFNMPHYLPHWSGEEGKLRRAAISMAINRDEITDVIFQGTRTPASDFTSPVIAGWSDSLEGAEVLEYDADEAQAKLWAEADAIAPVRRHRLRHRLQRRRRPPGLGRRSREQHREHARHRRRRQAVPDVRRGARRPREREADRCHPRRMAGRLPLDVQLPRAAVPHRCRVERRATTRARSSTRCSPRVPRQPPSKTATELYQQAAGGPVQGPPRHPAVVLERDRRFGRHGRQRGVRLGLGPALPRDHQGLSTRPV